jgi:hypothetical protein
VVVAERRRVQALLGETRKLLQEMKLDPRKGLTG